MSISQRMNDGQYPENGKIARWFVVLALWSMFAVPTLAADSDKTVAADTIVLGRVSKNSQKHYAALDALGRYLVDRSDDLKRNETLLARDNEEMIEFLKAGKVDLVSETPFSAVLYEQTADANILMRQWKRGRASYRTFFFARKDSSIQRIEDLAGKLIAFEDRGSTSGYFVPKATILDHDMVIKFADQARRSTDVGYLFADTEVNVVGWVARRKVDAGVISDDNWADESRAPLALKRQLHVFHKTPEVIRSVMVAGPRLTGRRLEGIVNILLTMHESDKGRAALKKFYKTKRFDHLSGEAKRSLDHVRLLFDRLGPGSS